ncbi:MBL fold metallo-hydrolase [Desulfococcus multivorans]|uniref:Beta-lactamase domain protein n=3 Tax=Desulfococcus TaxID=896 RepID=S7TXZ6_DESML|nr:MBL fold metallo-hydrolase [Desulfococcus multivorans]EPR41991.1 beta-lactamase domain protein [Desulfococcus multivorans DSM 2059]SKA10621.1 Ribonuclease BN, tRNA processing enzyme [Desulfococcus multivorans DSM 2059]
MKGRSMKLATDDLSVVVLGSGTCVPSLRRSACSVFMETGDAKLLFDIGPGTMRRLLEIDVEIFDVTHIFLSHFHPDHTGELVPFLFANKYPDGSRRSTPLVLAGGRGIQAFFDGLLNVYGHWIALPPDGFRIIEFDTDGPDVRSFEAFRVDTAPTEHNPESVAFRITAAGGRSAVYSGDTDYSDALIRLAHEADLLICEAAVPDAMKIVKHLTPALAGEIARRAEVKRLMLTHFYPPCEGADIRGECRKSFSGPLLLAEDLMRVDW